MAYRHRSILRSFLRTAALIAAAFAAAAGMAGAQSPEPGDILPAGTRISVLTNENVSGPAHAGAVISFRVVAEVRSGGTIIIPAGSIAHGRLVKKQQPADGEIALYSVELTDVALGTGLRPVVTNTRDIPIDPATNSPYSKRATGLIIVENTIFEFTLAEPLRIDQPAAGSDTGIKGEQP